MWLEEGEHQAIEYSTEHDYSEDLARVLLIKQIIRDSKNHQYFS
jgi:hypothetical protein